MGIFVIFMKKYLLGGLLYLGIGLSPNVANSQLAVVNSQGVVESMEEELEYRVLLDDVNNKLQDFENRTFGLNFHFSHLRMVNDYIWKNCKDYLVETNRTSRPWSIEKAIDNLFSFVKDQREENYDAILSYEDFFSKDLVTIDDMENVFYDSLKGLEELPQRDFVINEFVGKNYTDILDEVHTLFRGAMDYKLNKIELNGVLSAQEMLEIDRIKNHLANISVAYEMFKL
jgi:hypothetical protein